MALRIISEEYLPRKPLIECEADSINDLIDLRPAEGSTAWINGTAYIFENSTGWTLMGKGDFVVTLTPTAEDLSGVMDKNVGEIYDAYLRSQRIVFRVVTEDGYMEGPISAIAQETSYSYPSFNSYVVSDAHSAMIFVYTGMTNDSEVAAYGTTIFPLTPMT